MSLDVMLIVEDNTVYDCNITHNLGIMATRAGLYEALWSPFLIGTKAIDIIPNLSEGYIKMLKNPDYYKTFNPDNKWGSYETLLAFVCDYLRACIEYPNANIEICK